MILLLPLPSFKICLRDYVLLLTLLTCSFALLTYRLTYLHTYLHIYLPARATQSTTSTTTHIHPATITTTAAAISALSEDDVVKLADILISCSAGQKIYPSYSSPTSGNNTGTDGDEQCKQDVIHFLNALVRDLEFGSNHNIIEAASKYIVCLLYTSPSPRDQRGSGVASWA